MTIEEIFGLVSKMRDCQKEYFRTRSKDVLQQSKALERQLDNLLRRMQDSSLFDSKPEHSVMRGWAARDSDGWLCFYESRPVREPLSLCWQMNALPKQNFYRLPDGILPDVKWEDDGPTEVEISITKVL